MKPQPTARHAPIPRGLRRRWEASWHQVRYSLGARLIALFVVFALAITLIFMGGTQAALRSGLRDFVHPLVASYVDQLTAQIGTPPSVEQAQALTRRLPLRIRIEGPVVNWSSHPIPPQRDAWWGHRAAQRDSSVLTGSPWRPVRRLADGHTLQFGLANLARDDSPEDRPRLIGWATLAALLALTAFAYAVVRRLLRPLDDIRAGAIRYGQGDFSQPIAPRRNDELGDLAQQINRMADGLHHLLDAKRQLLLAISHELRSPLTRARLNAELVSEGTSRDALVHDLGEMRDLITDLLETERLSDGHVALHTEPGDLNAMVDELVAATQGSGRAVDALLDPALPTMPLDRIRIRLLLRNLLDNALRYNTTPGAAPVVITTAQVDGMVLLTVRDHGAGVGPDHLPHLAQAFYRVDTARQRATGGVGLGLYLCRLIAQAHGGTLTISNAHPGLQIDVRLPLSAAEVSH